MKRSFSNRRTSVCILVFTVAAAVAAVKVGANDDSRVRPGSPIPSATPIYYGYKGVKIGMTDEEARKLLGVPKEKSDSQDYFVYSENESAQTVYDSAHKVTAVSVTYLGQSPSIPTPKAVFGEGVDAKPDGSIFKMVRYPKDGFFVSYNKTAGEDPIVMITVQKIYGNPDN